MKVAMLIAALCCCSTVALAADSQGKALFMQNCAACHGAHGEGATGPRLAGDASKWSARLFERAVLAGIDDRGRPLKLAMPHWQQGSFNGDQGQAPSKAEIAAIQQYLKHPR